MVPIFSRISDNWEISAIRTRVPKNNKILYPFEELSKKKIQGVSFLDNKINSLSLIAFTLCSILLLMVQFAIISPSGIIVVSHIQYILLFWFSVIAFISSTANLVVRIPRHAKWSTGFSGEIARTVKITGESREYFIRGASESSIKEVLLDDWPFSEKDPESHWYVIDEQGNDVTSRPLGSIDGTTSVVIEEDNE